MSDIWEKDMEKEFIPYVFLSTGNIPRSLRVGKSKNLAIHWENDGYYAHDSNSYSYKIVEDGLGIGGINWKVIKFKNEDELDMDQEP